jgi:hypothetical protein
MIGRAANATVARSDIRGSRPYGHDPSGVALYTPLSPLAKPYSFRRDIPECKHSIHRAELNRFGRHTENDAGAFILRDIERPSLLHFQHPFGAVIAHAGHDDPDSILTAVARG